MAGYALIIKVDIALIGQIITTLVKNGRKDRMITKEETIEQLQELIDRYAEENYGDYLCEINTLENAIILLELEN